MLKKLVTMAVILSAALLLADLAILTRTTEGNLAFSVRTATYNGQYAPRNAGVIWITNAQNQFVKTIKVWANQYRYTLVRWIANSSGNTTGAITGASLNNHQLHNVTWNGRNYQNTEVADGTYNINVEFTEHNATAGNMGKYKQISFVKGPDPIDQTYPNETYFRDMALTWTPVVVNGTIFGTVTTGNGDPVVGALIQTGQYSVSTNVAGAYEISVPPGTWEMSCSAQNYHTQTVTGVEVVSTQATEVNFQLDAVSNADEVVPGVDGILSQAYPNPFRTGTKVKFLSPSPEPAILSVYNLKGQKVFGNVIPCAKGQVLEIQWQGKDYGQQPCPTGTYILRLRQGANAWSRKVRLAG
jgi:hypothetical protein